MKKVLLVILHILGYPVLLALVLYLNWDIMMTQAQNYGIFVFVGVIVAVVMALIYYICYAAITSKKKKKRKTIFNQTVRLCMAAVIPLTGLWAVCDLALPDFLAGATSSTIYYEDLADGWNDRAEVNEQLLDKFIELSVKAGTLPYDSDAMDESEAIAYYQSKGYNEAVSELSDNEYYGTIGGLFALQYQSMNANGYQSFTQPWISFATSDRLTIPCLVHLLLDEREINQDFITNYDYTEYKENADGTKEVTTVFFAVCDKATNTITLKNVNWTILDMDGKETALEIGNIPGMLPDNFSSLISLVINGSDLGPIVNPILSDLAGILASEGILGANINVIVETGPFVTEDAIKISLRPTTGYYYPEVLENTEIHRGTLGYQEMAWLESNGLIYALVTLFSTRRVFLLFAAWIALINILIGMVRGMCKEEKEKKRKIDAVQAPQKRIAPTYGTIRPYM